LFRGNPLNKIWESGELRLHEPFNLLLGDFFPKTWLEKARKARKGGFSFKKNSEEFVVGYFENWIIYRRQILPNKY